MMEGPVDLALTVLDRQLVDAHGRKCGRVDDVELEERPGGALEVTALLVGSEAWPGRMPNIVGRMVARLAGGDGVRVPWSDIAGISHVVKLTKPAADLGLGRRDDRAGRWIGRLPLA
jgi:sporulation protein YlmC with PRC-barrel domain